MSLVSPGKACTGGSLCSAVREFVCLLWDSYCMLGKHGLYLHNKVGEKQIVIKKQRFSEKAMATHSSVLAWRIPGTVSLVGCHLWGRTESGMTEVT